MLVAVRGSSAEEAAVSGLDFHGGADSGADAVAFAFAHAAEEGHDEVVGFGVGVDASADLGDPEFDAVVDEEGEGEAELVAAEGPVGFADDDGVEASGSVGERGEEAGGFGSALPGERAGLADVEVLDDDLAAGGGDEVVGSVELPGPAGGGVLAVLGADPAVERECLHGHDAIPSL